MANGKSPNLHNVSASDTLLTSIIGLEVNEASESAPAWEDPDDDPILISSADPEWARKRRLTTNEKNRQLPTKVLASKPRKRTSTAFGITRQSATGHRLEFSGGVQRIEFDHNGSLMGVLQLHGKCLKLFSVDQQKSNSHSRFRLKPGMHEVKLDGYSTSSFAFGSEKIFMIGNRSNILSYDVKLGAASVIATITRGSHESYFDRIYTNPDSDGDTHWDMYAVTCYDNGTVYLCDSRTSEPIFDLHVNSKKCVGVGFFNNRNALVLSDADANVYHWDIKSGRCIGRFTDKHSLHVSSFGSFQGKNKEYGTGAFIANGSITGYLNIFSVLNGKSDTESLMDSTPTRSLGNLSTEVTNIAVHPEGKFVGFSSVHKRNALRLLHLETNTVVENWPGDHFNIGRPTSSAFCPNFDAFAVGNKFGRLHLYKIVY